MCRVLERLKHNRHKRFPHRNFQESSNYEVQNSEAIFTAATARMRLAIKAELAPNLTGFVNKNSLENIQIRRVLF